MGKINADELLKACELSDEELEGVSGGWAVNCGYASFDECYEAKLPGHSDFEATFCCNNGFYPDPSGTR